MTTPARPHQNRLFAACIKFTTFGLICAFTVACAPKKVNTHGHVISERRLDAIQPGITTKEGVRRLLGTPPVTSAFDENTWIYLTEKTTSERFGQKELQGRKIITITFYPDLGTVANVKETDESQARDVTISESKTPTSGQSLGVIDQLLGNIGVSP